MISMLENDLSPRRGISIVLISVLAVTGFFLRLAPLGRYVTPDEPNWVYRSIRFRDALAARDWSAVPSTGHPGVTTMWLGAVGVTAARWLNPVRSADHLNWIRNLAWLAPDNGAAFPHLAFFLPYGRIAVATTTTVALVALYWLLRRRFDQLLALLVVGLLALDPFLVGHSGLLHTDALLATFCLLTIALILNGLREPQRLAWWGLVGLSSGLALLTKTPGALAVAFGFGGAVLCSWRSAPGESGLVHGVRETARRVLPFVGAAAMTVLILNPGLWSDPGAALRDLSSSAARHMQVAPRPVFFAGQMTYDPGMGFYGVVLLFRLSPVALVGLIIGLMRLSHLTSDRRGALLIALGFAVLFALGMGLGEKKHDRYMLPALVPLALASVVGWEELGRWVRGRVGRPWDGWWPASPSGVGALLIGVQLLLALTFTPYPLSYANPAVGGRWIASRLFWLDWGEGMGAAARWLNGRANASELTVAASSVPTFGSVFAGATVPLEQAALADYFVRDISLASESGYDDPVAHRVTVGSARHVVVMTNTAPIEQAEYLANHAGTGDLILVDAETALLRKHQGPGALRSMASVSDESDMAVWLEQHAPTHGSLWLVSWPGSSRITGQHLRRQLAAVGVSLGTDTVAGATIAQYAVRDRVATRSAPAYRAAFEGRLALVDGVVDEAVVWPDDLRVDLRWRALDSPGANYRAAVTLRDDAGYAWSQAERQVVNSVFFPTSAWQAGHWSDATFSLGLPPGVPPGRYAVDVSLYREDTGARVGAAGPDGGFEGTLVPVGEVVVLPPEIAPGIDAMDVTEPLDIAAGPLVLIGMVPPPKEVLSGDTLSFHLFWQADLAPETDHRVRVRLVASDGAEELEELFPLSRHPTSSWQAGSRFQSRYEVHIPPDLRTGRYRLTLDVLNARDRCLLEDPIYLASTEVLSRERSFALPEDVPQHLDLLFGESARLLGYALETAEVRRGQGLDLTLYWQAERATDASYTLFVHLLGPDGGVYGQVDRVPGDGRAPTSSWAAGQVIVEQVLLQLAPTAPVGTYRIAIGFYDAAYGDRLTVFDASGRPVDAGRAILPVEVTVSGGEE